ncbi:MAG: Hsp33 family molecular chaperone HslO [Christensenellaceae bacterium]|jgi:molecular chaperone Hsp33|nr:Hsp33 family molecular chaperone HslO [Christensenellaceae bacterium]
MDEILHVEIELGQARALVCVSSDLAAEAQRIHGLSHLASAALGRALTGAAMLGALQKNEKDRLTMTFRGDGPLSPVVTLSNGKGEVKGYLENGSLELPLKPSGKLDVGGGVGHEGRLIVVRDLGLREPYVGQTRLVSGEIAEDIALYLSASEQTPSLFALGVRLEEGKVVSSGGVLIQPLPGCSEELLQKLEGLAGRLANISNLSKEACGSAAALVSLCLPGLNYEILESIKPVWRCDCSLERIQRALLSMGAGELNDMIEKQGGAELSCHFCNKKYNLSAEELRHLLQEGLSED